MANSVSIDLTGSEDKATTHLALHTNGAGLTEPSRKRKIQQTTSEARTKSLLVTADGTVAHTASKRVRKEKQNARPRPKGPCVVCGEITEERCFKHTSCDATRTPPVTPTRVWVLVRTEDKEGRVPDWEVQCDSSIVGVFTSRDLAEKAKKQETRGMESNDGEVYHNGTCYNTSFVIHMEHIETEVEVDSGDDNTW